MINESGFSHLEVMTLVEEYQKLGGYIHNADDRKMLLLRLIDGMTFEQIGFEMSMTTKTVRIRIHKGEAILFRHLPG